MKLPRRNSNKVLLKKTINNLTELQEHDLDEVTSEDSLSEEVIAAIQDRLSDTRNETDIAINLIRIARYCLVVAHRLLFDWVW